MTFRSAARPSQSSHQEPPGSEGLAVPVESVFSRNAFSLPLKFRGNHFDAPDDIGIYLKVPEPEHRPPEVNECLIGQLVALLISADFRVPIFTRLARSEVVWVPVPEATVNEDCDLRWPE